MQATLLLQFTPQLAAKLAVSGAFFARKLTVGSNLGEWKLHR